MFPHIKFVAHCYEVSEISGKETVDGHVLQNNKIWSLANLGSIHSHYGKISIRGPVLMGRTHIQRLELRF